MIFGALATGRRFFVCDGAGSACGLGRHRRPHPVRVLHERCARAATACSHRSSRRRWRARRSRRRICRCARTSARWRTTASPRCWPARKKSQAKDAIDECQDEADASVDALPRVPLGLDETDENRKQRAESYALATACTLAGREMSSIPIFGGGRIGSRIDEAVKLEPKNPRVRLVEALAQFERAGKDASEKAVGAAQPAHRDADVRAGARRRVEHAGVGRGGSLCFPRPRAVRPARRGGRARGARALAADRAGLRLRPQAHGADNPLDSCDEIRAPVRPARSRLHAPPQSHRHGLDAHGPRGSRARFPQARGVFRRARARRRRVVSFGRHRAEPRRLGQAVRGQALGATRSRPPPAGHRRRARGGRTHLHADPAHRPLRLSPVSRGADVAARADQPLQAAARCPRTACATRSRTS